MSSPAPAAPVKLPMKFPPSGPGAVKLLCKLPAGIAVKLPPSKPFVPPPVPPSTSVVASAGATHAPAPAAAPASAQVSKKKFRSARDDDDDDDAYALISGNGRAAAPAASPAVKAPAKVVPQPKADVAPRQPAKQARRVERPPSPSSSSSESDDEEGMSLFKLAKKKGAVPQHNVDELLKEDVVIPVGPPPRPPVQKRFYSDIDGAITRLKERLRAEEAKARIKEDNKTVSLGTSKVNYIDPRIICSWCKREKLNLSKVFSATLQKKFPWARDCPEDYEF